jgi:hypothetical protein
VISKSQFLFFILIWVSSRSSEYTLGANRDIEPAKSAATVMAATANECTTGARWRFMLRKPGTPDYGVELGAPADAARLQIRLVGSDRPSTPRNTQRDRDQETIWCSEFGRLQDLIAKSSGELIIERAQPVGAIAVKTVAMGISEGEVRDIDRQRNDRTF